MAKGSQRQVEEARLCLGDKVGPDQAQGWARVGLGCLDTTRRRSMLDSHTLAPHPELTLRIFGEVVGQEEGEAEVEVDRTERDGLTLAHKQHGRPREREGGGPEAAFC